MALNYQLEHNLDASRNVDNLEYDWLFLCDDDNDDNDDDGNDDDDDDNDDDVNCQLSTLE